VLQIRQSLVARSEDQTELKLRGPVSGILGTSKQSDVISNYCGRAVGSDSMLAMSV
jgi:hypothetical protein